MAVDMERNAGRAREDRMDIVRQWTAVLLPPMAVLFDINVSYALVQYACFSDAPFVLWLVTVATLLMLGLSWHCARRSYSSYPRSGDEGVAGSRSRFMGLNGLWLTVLGVIVTISLAVPKMMIDPCG